MVRWPASFVWDEGNQKKCQKQGLSIAEIEAFFAGTPRVAPDLKHSGTEERFVAVGRDRHGRPIFVVFTMREREGQLHIRPISARHMHRKEIEGYEKKSSEA